MFKRSLILLPLLLLAACGEPRDPEGAPVIKRTSDNTWSIYDPTDYNTGETTPEAYLDKTCQTEDRTVVQVQTPGEAYEWLNVVCGPLPGAPSATGTPTPAPTTSEGFDG